MRQNWLAPFNGDHDQEDKVNQLQKKPDHVYEKIMDAYGGTGIARYDVTSNNKTCTRFQKTTD